MLIAQAKKEENVIEYILYMFQLQDLIRGLRFEEESIRSNLAVPMATSKKQEELIMDWYRDLVKKMTNEGLREKGFISDVLSVIGELSLLHGMLMQQLNDKTYAGIFEKARPFIEEYKVKSKDEKVSDILICINAMYAKLLLKLKKTPISKESEEAFTTFSALLAYLAIKYKEMYQGKLSYSLN